VVGGREDVASILLPRGEGGRRPDEGHLSISGRLDAAAMLTLIRRLRRHLLPEGEGFLIQTLVIFPLAFIAPIGLGFEYSYRGTLRFRGSTVNQFLKRSMSSSAWIRCR